MSVAGLPSTYSITWVLRLLSEFRNHAIADESEYHHVVTYSDTNIDSKNSDPFSIYRVYDESDLHTLQSALIDWVNREANWKNATHHMLQCLKLQGHISSERIMSAFRWLEQTPTFNYKQIISNDALNWVIKAAQNEAESILASNQLLNKQTRDRIRGALSLLRNESFNDLIERTEARLGNKYPIIKSMPELKKYLKRSRETRSQAAHSIVSYAGKLNITTLFL